MSTYNSIKPIHYLLYLILIITSGCAQKPTSHIVINETPAAIDNASDYTAPTVKTHIRTETVQTKNSKNTPNTVWDRLFSLYALPEIENKRIDRELQKYLKHPKYLAKIQQRAKPYLYYILDQIELKKIPGEMALLPVVESAFIPTAVSKSNASGLWQFMPATGRLFGLKQNQWYDGRNDIYTSTQAATTYLKQLGSLYDNDWFMALAAYNAGKGTIRKKIRQNRKKNLADDYWSLPLRKETMDYVPRLIAIAKIFANAEKYGLILDDIPNEPYFSIVTTDSQIDIDIASTIAKTPIADFITLNPGFKRSTTDPDGPYHLLIHTEKAAEFKKNLALTAKKDRVNWFQHKIKAGENLGFLAKKYNTSVNALRQSNHLKSNLIKVGQLLLIPTSSLAANSSSEKLYTVKKGDTFWDIARQFSVSSRDIANWNNLSLKKMLQPGQKLIIKES